MTKNDNEIKCIGKKGYNINCTFKVKYPEDNPIVCGNHVRILDFSENKQKEINYCVRCGKNTWWKNQKNKSCDECREKDRMKRAKKKAEKEKYCKKCIGSIAVKNFDGKFEPHPCQATNLKFPKNDPYVCGNHTYLLEFDEEQLDNLRFCSSCRRTTWWKSKNEMCDKCQLSKANQRKKNRMELDRCQLVLNNSQLCKLAAIPGKRFCSRHNEYEKYTDEEIGSQFHCSDCGHRRIFDGFKTCKKCRVYRKDCRRIKVESREDDEDYHICERCSFRGKIEHDDKFYCKKHYDILLRNIRGICSSRWKCDNKALEGKKICKECLERRRGNDNKRHKTNKEKWRSMEEERMNECIQNELNCRKDERSQELMRLCNLFGHICCECGHEYMLFITEFGNLSKRCRKCYRKCRMRFRDRDWKGQQKKEIIKDSAYRERMRKYYKKYRAMRMIKEGTC